MTATMTASRYCKAVAWIPVRGKPTAILPLIALKYFALFLCCLAAVVAIVEWRLGALAETGRVGSTSWQQQNDRVNAWNKIKNPATRDDPLWRSAGISPAPAAAPGQVRILVIGDSFVWGDGYENVNDTWWRQLERELHRRGYGQAEVIAAGTPGASTQDQLRWLRTRGLAGLGSPDLIVFGYVTNDPDVRDAEGRRLVKQVREDVKFPRWRFLDKSLGKVAPNLTQQLQQRRLAKAETRVPDAYAYKDWELKILEPPNFDAYRDIVLELGALLRGENIPHLFVTLPNAPDEDGFRARYAPVERLFAAAGIPFHNLLGDFTRDYELGEEVLRWGINPVNAHPGTISTRFHARKTADILERHYAHLLGPKSVPPAPPRPVINDWMPPAAAVQQVGAGAWAFTYPPAGTPLLELPVGTPHVLLSFAEPVPITRIGLDGEGLAAAQVYITSTDPDSGVDPRTPLALGRRSGDALSWDLQAVAGAERVNTLRIAAEFAPAAGTADGHRLRLTIAPAPAATAELR